MNRYYYFESNLTETCRLRDKKRVPYQLIGVSQTGSFGLYRANLKRFLSRLLRRSVLGIEVPLTTMIGAPFK